MEPRRVESRSEETKFGEPGRYREVAARRGEHDAAPAAKRRREMRDTVATRPRQQRAPRSGRTTPRTANTFSIPVEEPSDEESDAADEGHQRAEEVDHSVQRLEAMAILQIYAAHGDAGGRVGDRCLELCQGLDLDELTQTLTSASLGDELARELLRVSPPAEAPRSA